MVEKETKTKAYSKEGLGASTKLDPAAKEKREVEHWIQEAIKELESQTDQFESAKESIETSGSKKKNKNDKNVSHLHKIGPILSCVNILFSLSFWFLR